MPTIPEAEARRLLSQRLICEEATDWRPRHDGRALQIQAGLIDEAGLNTGLVVKLSFHPGTRAGSAHYTFSVFRLNSYGQDRVYQLCVNQADKRDPDVHSKPHEHFGSLKSVGSAAWQNWKYEDVLARFCAQTKIVFIPVPPAPMRTNRKWNCHEQSSRYVWQQHSGV